MSTKKAKVAKVLSSGPVVTSKEKVKAIVDLIYEWATGIAYSDAELLDRIRDTLDGKTYKMVFSQRTVKQIGEKETVHYVGKVRFSPPITLRKAEEVLYAMGYTRYRITGEGKKRAVWGVRDSQ